ncbi:hypothetical protein O9992_28055 [Vibrio lentus]|nr:hypothetical protein [Vibrio lentus]
MPDRQRRRPRRQLATLAWWLLLKALPVIVLTAKVKVQQRVEGLMAGAKDYVTQAIFER